MSFSTNYHQVSMLGKFGKRILIEKNLGNGCLMIWGRHIEREDVVKFAAWLLLRFNITPQELLDVEADVEKDSAKPNAPKKLPVRARFDIFLADYKASLNK